MTTVINYVTMSKYTGWKLSTRKRKINAGGIRDKHRLSGDILELDISNHQRSEALKQFLEWVRVQETNKVAQSLCRLQQQGLNSMIWGIPSCPELFYVKEERVTSWVDTGT